MQNWRRSESSAEQRQKRAEQLVDNIDAYRKAILHLQSSLEECESELIELGYQP